jgi:hypothetical protein
VRADAELSVAEMAARIDAEALSVARSVVLVIVRSIGNSHLLRR